MDVMISAVAGWLRAHLRAEHGAHFVEYGLLVCLIAIVAMVAIHAIGDGVASQFSTITSHVSE
jgi:Flp pilus assembly pilin Flp